VSHVAVSRDDTAGSSANTQRVGYNHHHYDLHIWQLGYQENAEKCHLHVTG